jgi:F-type H+-transporting ATPase subunit b
LTEEDVMKLPGTRRKLLRVFTALLALCLIFAVGVALAEEGQGHGESGGGGITVMPDMSVFIQIANFLFLIMVLNIIVYKPIRGILIQRRDKVKGLEDGINTFQNNAREKEESYVSGIKKARALGLKEKQSLVDAALEQEKAIVDRIHRQAQAELAQIREKVAKEADDAKVELLKEVDGFANAIGEKILGRAF